MMKVRCPKCRTLYRINPPPVPVGDKTARCSRCGEVFRLADNAVAPATAPAPTPQPSQGAAPRPAASEAPRGEARSGAPAEPAPAPPPPPAVPAAAAPATRAEPAASAGKAASTSTTSAPASGAFRFFGPQDPHQRARHLARALVSDIVAYYPDRLEKSRAAGTLREEFREEILKSWEEYVLQVGAEFARETDHFQTALNDILARGEKVF